MEGRIRDFPQTDFILDDDLITIDREGVPMVVTGKTYKAFCSKTLNSPVRYYKGENIPCTTRDDVYQLGNSLLSLSGSEGLPLWVVLGDYHEKSWVYAVQGNPNSLKVFYNGVFSSFQEGDSSFLEDIFFFETLYGLLPGTEKLHYKVLELEE